MMIIIDLHDYYPHEPKDSYIEVSEEVAAALKEFERQDAARQVKEYRYKAYYSLDASDGIENSAVEKPETPQEVLERQMTKTLLFRAISILSPIQARRVYARYILEKSVSDIADLEGVSHASVIESINRALNSMAKFLEEN